MDLVRELLSGFVESGTEPAAVVVESAYRAQREQDEWVAKLRARGVKAAHPDDGWVNKKENKLCFCYPQFNDGAGVGDLVALGYPWMHKSGSRIVRLTAREEDRVVGPWWYFEEVERGVFGIEVQP